MFKKIEKHHNSGTELCFFAVSRQRKILISGKKLEVSRSKKNFFWVFLVQSVSWLQLCKFPVESPGSTVPSCICKDYFRIGSTVNMRLGKVAGGKNNLEMLTSKNPTNLQEFRNNTMTFFLHLTCFIFLLSGSICLSDSLFKIPTGSFLMQHF